MRQETLLIETVGAHGDGVAAGPIFAPYALPGERVLARVGGAYGEVSDIVQVSPDRVVPVCRHFGACGGCALQHWARAPYLAWKSEQIRLALARERLETEIMPAVVVAPGSRRRVALHVRRGPNGSALLGFKRRRSWRIEPIEVCPVTTSAIVSALPALRLLAEPFLEHPLSAPTLHITATLTGLEVDVGGVERRRDGLSADARARAAALAAAADLARLTLAGEILYFSRDPRVRIGSASVVPPPGAFLQACAEAEEAMARFVVGETAGASRIVDLFCGLGAFALRLAAIAPVMAFDASAAAIEALRAAQDGATGRKPVAAQVRDLVRRPVLAREMRGVDVAVFDPPRAGAAEQAMQLAGSTVDRVIGASCAPVTFARDARRLVDGGFTLNRILPVDQFLWSPHIELVALFGREGGK